MTAYARACAYFASTRRTTRVQPGLVLSLAGEQISINSLPAEWRDVALLVRETRAVLRQQNKEARNGK